MSVHVANALFSLPISVPKAGQCDRWEALSGFPLAQAIISLYAAHEGPLLLLFSQSSERETVCYHLETLGGESLPIYSVPDWETLPYDHFSPHQDIISERLLTLRRLSQGQRGIYALNASTALHRLCPSSHFDRYHFDVQKGLQLEVTDFLRQLVKAGYESVKTVQLPGTFCQRGGIVDVYPNGAKSPIRIEFFDDEVESLRAFDPDTQLSGEQMPGLTLLPAKEYPTDPESKAQFVARWRSTFAENRHQAAFLQSVMEETLPPGIEYYLPLFFEETATLFSYCPQQTLCVRLGDHTAVQERFWQEVTHRYEQRAHDIEHPRLKPADVFIPPSDFNQAIKGFTRIDIPATTSETPSSTDWVQALPNLSMDNRARQPLTRFLRAKELLVPDKTVVMCETPGRREVIRQLLTQTGLEAVMLSNLDAIPALTTEQVGLWVFPTAQGGFFPGAGLWMVPEAALYGQRTVQTRQALRRKEDTQGVAIRDVVELEIGDAVVHLDHGVGRYLGLQHLAIGSVENEFVVLEYANQDKLYVPVSALHMISRYSGVNPEQAPVNRLGTDQWDKSKEKALQKARDVAAELLDVYARRAANIGHAFGVDTDHYAAFCREFPFEETPDQLTAIHATLKDMASKQPMDRLVCGDVGFGKTEVAMRAAFVAVENQKQVAVLVPTTLLAQQHVENFRDRFAAWPVNIGILSRFQTAKETAATREKMANGQLDIVIGTHKLLQSDLTFKRLGLVIVDEEHRFGVRQKERLKSLVSHVDMLSLTATPIPRTLNMALSGIRDLSIIASPPAKRLSIRTFVQPYDEATAREAILRELMRGGQVYYLHNDIDTIALHTEKLQALIPEAKIQFAHGQMRERELERIMSDFYHQRFSVLVCTTIIETGIDIPSANTIIMDRADKLGLAQLHQLRGRVGRSHHQAYAYCFTPHPKRLTAQARKRLEAFASLEDLGAGFSLASHDMEIRGAGELLGDEQSGQIEAVGYTLYLDLLQRAVAALKAGQTLDLNTPLHGQTEVELNLGARIPESYIPDVDLRLIFYRRIANAESESALYAIQVEMIDRFGLIPEPLEHLILATKLKIAISPAAIQKVDVTPTVVRIKFGQAPKIQPQKLIALIQKQPQRYRLKGTEQLSIQNPGDTVDKQLRTIENVVKAIME